MQVFKNSNNSHKNPSKRKPNADIVMPASLIGKQCMAISLYAISFQCVKDVARWTPTNLHSVLENGNTFLHSLEAYSNLEHLLCQLSILDCTVDISYNLKRSGILTTTKNDRDELIKLIEQNSSNNNGFLLWLGEICVAVILKHNKISTLKY